MVTMKWARDEQGRPVPIWKAEAPSAAQAQAFGTHYRKAARPANRVRPMVRCPLRMTAAAK